MKDFCATSQLQRSYIYLLQCGLRLRDEALNVYLFNYLLTVQVLSSSCLSFVQGEFPPPPKSSGVEVLAPGASECGLIWQPGHCRYNWLE